MDKVFSIGLVIPGNAAEHISIRSDRSLFDADVIIFAPGFGEYASHENYAGKRLISEYDSPKFVADCRHWRNELKTAVEAGKVVYFFLSRTEEVYYDSGQRTYSGTGRNRQTTRQVLSSNSYEMMPFDFEGLTPRGGSEVTPFNSLGALSAYWHQFGSQSAYEVYFSPKGLDPILGTKNREKVVGGVLRHKSGGALVFLPPVQWDETGMTYTRGHQTYWNTKGTAFGKQFVSALIEAAQAFRREGRRSPVPEWAAGAEYSTGPERKLKTEIEQIDGQMAALAEERKIAHLEMENAGTLRWLLYETGKPLERSILCALELLGFKAEAYKNANSEFDAVFTAPEGRCLGEAEGKENRPINVDKISQLARNLEEDFTRDDVAEYAKAVLFGNAQRLQPLASRSEFFTEKCKQAASRMKAALIRTPDLFPVARYLVEHENTEYAAACRKVIFATEGEKVVFPPIPEPQKAAPDS